VRLKPDFADAHNNLGGALFETGQLQEAIEQYEQVLRLKPDFPEAHNNLGTILIRAGQPRGAIEHFKQAYCSIPTMQKRTGGWGPL
jgi:tetratricopeptide (TPR) repeat protein